MDAFKKIVRIGKMDTGRASLSDIFCKIEYTKDGKLSISGVVGPMRNGNARGGCGQINMEFEHRNPEHNDDRYTNPVKPSDIEFAPGWDADKWYTFLEYWELYHLNDTKAGCEHQRALGWGKKKLTIVTHKLKMEIVNQQNEIKEAALKALKKRGKAVIGDKEKELLCLPYEVKTSDTDDAEVLMEYYKEAEREEKTDGWVYEKEHPEGKLCKPCPECGYKYGTSWNFLTVPEEVLTFLASLPDTDVQPAWI